MLAVGQTALSLVISLTLALFIANAGEIDGSSSVPPPQCIQLGCDEDTPTEIDPLTAADLLAFAEMGRDRCGLSPFAAWSLFGRYRLRWRDFRVGVEHAGKRSGEGMIGPNFQFAARCRGRDSENVQPTRHAGSVPTHARRIGQIR
jgi:hypothetical protein